MILKSIKHLAYFMNYSSQKIFDDVKNNVFTYSNYGSNSEHPHGYVSMNTELFYPIINERVTN